MEAAAVHPSHLCFDQVSVQDFSLSKILNINNIVAKDINDCVNTATKKLTYYESSSDQQMFSKPIPVLEILTSIATYVVLLI